MKKKNLILIICAAAVFLCAVIGLAFVFAKNNSPAKIGFYKVSPKIQNAVMSIANANLSAKYEALELDSNSSLEVQKKQIKKCSILIFNDDAASSDFLLKNVAKGLNFSFTEGYPVSIKNSIQKENLLSQNKSKSENEEIKILPFIYDFYELDVFRPHYDKIGQQALDVWEDLVLAAYKEIKLTDTPLVLPFASDEDFLDCLGMLTEALCGYETYERISAEISGAKNSKIKIQKILETYCAEGQPFDQVLKEITSLIKGDIISRSSMKLTNQDVFFYLDNGLCGIGFIKLSEHRNLSKEVSNLLTSIYIPSKEFTPERKFSAQPICLSLIKNNKDSLEFAKNLCSTWQSDLAMQTGLAPVQKNCTVPDHQADDVRFWLAASKGPVLPLSKFFYSKELSSIAAEILKARIQL